MHQVLTIAASDSGGGAGIQADLKTFAALGVYGMSVITALTAQNTLGVRGIAGTAPEFVIGQLDAVKTDMQIEAMKTGMLFSEEIILALADYWQHTRKPWMVVDPVMVATSGDHLIEEGAVRALREKLLPMADVLTPNQDEAGVLTGYRLETIDDVYKAGRDLLRLGCKTVVITGVKTRHSFGDFYFKGSYRRVYESEYIETSHTHGTGCSFSAALAAWLAKGRQLPEAVRLAQLFVNRGLYYAFAVGQGSGPLNHMAAFYPCCLTDPALCELKGEMYKEEKSRFEELDKPLVNVIVGGEEQVDIDYYQLCADLVKAGAGLIQYRQKQGDSSLLLRQAAEIKKACKNYGALLVVNDRVDIALACDADGVHLGQDDLPVKTARAILGPDKIIGVSAGNVAEALRAQDEGADYIGVGPSYTTQSKQVSRPAGGAAQIADVYNHTDIPIVAIGGVNAENAAPLIRAGACGAAVISYVRNAADPAAAVRRLKIAMAAAKSV